MVNKQKLSEFDCKGIKSNKKNKKRDKIFTVNNKNLIDLEEDMNMMQDINKILDK